MGLLIRGVLCACIVYAPWAACGDEPDGTAFTHSVLTVDGPALLRIRYCGVPLQVRLANIQLKGTEAQTLQFLKENLRPGTTVKIELEIDLAGDTLFPPPVQVFAAGTHINLELVKRGLAISDGRSNKYGAAMQAAQLEAMDKKTGMWGAPGSLAADAPHVEKTVETPAAAHVQSAPAASADAVQSSEAPLGYNGAVVADLSSKEYHFPGNRYARAIRPGARIEYKSPEEAERAGKSPSPFSFPERARALLAKLHASSPSGDSTAKIIDDSRKALSQALGYMQEARRASKTNNALANENWKKAAKILIDNIDRITPISDANPNDRDVQKLAEDMSMNLYSCNKYQSL